ncbi:MAG: antiporter subunit [Cypionkella sp.]|uniref:monovalent cation/H+ antiporter complex subunit F n=1 Tax=Cypionkella sp. TaxID=2811411 RepID=UPI00260839B7|nr:monovalent cation/H+ antiporter complex subunit F [Cypionkella sp.]MDB5660998.1 antiporter subunit [Cypionkella sp.]MDB5664317.1 antiporter subunit [Cypionkella sp.]
MLGYALPFAIACFALALLLNLWRLATAPTVLDRILVVDTMVINMLALIVLYGAQSRSAISMDIGMLFAMTGYFGTVAFCKFYLRGRIVE